MNGVVIGEVPMLLRPIPSETLQTIQANKSFNVTHPLIILLSITGFAIYLNIRNPTQEEYEDPDILKLDIMTEAQP